MAFHGLDGHGRCALRGILVAGIHVVGVCHGIVRALHQRLAAVLHGEVWREGLAVVDHGQDVGDGDVGVRQLFLVLHVETGLGALHLEGVGLGAGARILRHEGQVYLLQQVDVLRAAR